MASRKKPQDFEQSLAALETLVAKMEKGDLSLEDSLKAFEEGVQLTRECQARLQAAEQRVQRGRVGEIGDAVVVVVGILGVVLAAVAVGIRRWATDPARLPSRADVGGIDDLVPVIVGVDKVAQAVEIEVDACCSRQPGEDTLIV